MIKASVMYPAKEGAKFDHDYYVNKHMAIVKEKGKDMGLIKTEVVKGLSGNPGQPAPYVCIGSLYFESTGDLQKFFMAAGPALMADLPNFTDIRAESQVSEILE